MPVFENSPELFASRVAAVADALLEHWSPSIRDGKFVVQEDWVFPMEPFHVSRWTLEVSPKNSRRARATITLENGWLSTLLDDGKAPYAWRASTMDYAPSTENISTLAGAAAELYLKMLGLRYR